MYHNTKQLVSETTFWKEINVVKYDQYYIWMKVSCNRNIEHRVSLFTWESYWGEFTMWFTLSSSTLYSKHTLQKLRIVYENGGGGGNQTGSAIFSYTTVLGITEPFLRRQISGYSARRSVS